MRRLLTPYEIGLMEESFGEDLENILSDKELNQYIYSKGYYDLPWFTDYHLQDWKVNQDTGQRIPSPDFHKEILYSMRDLKRTVVIIPRDHAKTTVAKMFYIWSLVYKFDKSILLLMPTDLGIKVLGDIRDELEQNISLRAIFGKTMPDRKENKNKKWTSSILQLLNGTQIQVIPKKGAIRGQRPTLLSIDDPQELEDVLNEEQAKKFSHRFWSSVYNTLQPTGRCVVLGTVISENCLVNEIANKKEQFNVIRKQAITRIKKFRGKIIGGKPLWSELWDIDALEERRMDIGDDLFNQEYQNIAHSFNHSPVFGNKNLLTMVIPVREVDGIRFYVDYVVEGMVFGIDTAEGHKTSDFSTIIGRDRTGKLICSYRARVSEDVLAQKMDRIFDLGYRGIVNPETNKGQLLLAELKQFWWFDDYIYFETDESSDTERESSRYGTYTNSKNKKLMIKQYDVILRYCSEKAKGVDIAPMVLESWNRKASINGVKDWEICEELKLEIENFAWNGKGGAEALAGHHDDLLMADFMCNQARKMPARSVVDVGLNELGLVK